MVLAAVLMGSRVFAGESGSMDVQDVAERLREHMKVLTVDIGERSVSVPENIKRSEAYIEAFYRELGLEVSKESYRFRGFTVANVIGRLDFSDRPKYHYIVGAHYDSVSGTVGADDNASAIAVQLELARRLKALQSQGKRDVSVRFVSFPLEEPPAFVSDAMGSRVYAERARREGERIDGMICLEMVGYTCLTPGCQDYPFPLNHLRFPKIGNFIGIVGNTKSMGFTRSLKKAFKKNRDLPVISLSVPFNGKMVPAVRRSDHASFWDTGFKAVMVTDTAFFRNPHYHTKLDTMDRLDYTFMAELVESLSMFFDPRE